jgi:hypothetical protein
VDGFHRTMKMVFLHIGKAVFGALLVVMGAGTIAFMVTPEFRMGVDKDIDAFSFVGFSPDSLYFIAESLLIVLGGMLFMCGMCYLFLAVAPESLNLCRNSSMPRPAERKLVLQKRHTARRAVLDKRWLNRIDESEKAILDAAPPPVWRYWAPALHIARLSNLRALHRARLTSITNRSLRELEEKKER